MGTSRKDEHATEGEFKRGVRVAKARRGLVCHTLYHIAGHLLLPRSEEFLSVYTPHLYKDEKA